MVTSGTDLLVKIAGSATLLLWGARMARTGMVRSFGADIRKFLVNSTANRFIAALMGLGAAAMLQSSTAVALLTTSFASAGLLGAAAGLAIMLGADLGSALIAQVLSLNIRGLWPLFMFAGYILHSVFESRSLKGKQSGRILMGLGLIFLSLSVLASAGEVLRQSNIIAELFASMGNEPLIAILVAAILTWVAHSSLAVLLLIAVLAKGGVLDHGFLSFYLVLGINAGAALPAFMLTLSEPPVARQIAFGNLIFRLAGVIVAAYLGTQWMPYLLEWNVEPGQKLIFLHIAFNTLLLVIFIMSTQGMARLTSHMVPAEVAVEDEWAPRYLDPSAQEVPTIALSMVARETLRMVDVVETMLQRSMEALRNSDLELCDETHQMDDRVDTLYEAIKFYVTDLTRAELEKEEGRRAFEIMSFTTNLENAGDVIDRSLLGTISKKIKTGRNFSEEGFAEIEEMYDYLRETINLASNVFMERTVENARALLKRKQQFRDIEKKSTDGHYSRLRSGETTTIETSAYHMDILRDFKSINSHFASVAYPILEAVGELRDIRLKKIKH